MSGDPLHPDGTGGERRQFLTEIEVKEKMEERTGWRGHNESQIVGEEKRNGRLVGAAETSKERAEWRRLQRKYLSILGLLRRKGWPRCHRESSWQVRQSRLCQKIEEQSRLPRAPVSDRKEGIQCQRSKENSSKGKKKRRVFLCRRTVRVKVKTKVILTSFPKTQERETFVGAKDRRKRDG